MSSAVESIYVSSLIMGLAIHETACAGYFLIAKLLKDKSQVKKPLFILCIFTFFSILMYNACMIAILHYKARGSKDPLAVQTAWFTNIATANVVA
jgi:hypothetical protein